MLEGTEPPFHKPSYRTLQRKWLHILRGALPFSLGVPVTLKSLRKKDYSDYPRTLGEHLKKRRRGLGLLQREAAKQLGVAVETLINWEKDRTRPVAVQFRPVIAFLGYDPSPEAKTLAKRVEAKRRALGVTFEQVADYLGWDRASLNRYLRGIWRMKADRAAALEKFLTAPLSDLEPLLRLPKRKR